MKDNKNIAVVFPGQGSQRSGMGKDFYEQISVCRETFEEAAEALGWDVSAMCFGEDERLNLTEYTQPCIVTTEICMLRGLADRYGFAPDYFGGHSLGEFTALVAAGVMPLADTVKIVQTRGRLMQEAVPVGVGGMAAVISGNIDIDMLRKTMQGLAADVANINSANQVVISGELPAIDETEKRLTLNFPAEKTFRFIRLNVSAPFHSRLMKTIEDRFADTLEKFGHNLNPLNAAKVTSNFTGGFHAESVSDVRKNLVHQISNTVNWRNNMQALAQKAEEIYEVGPGRPLRDFFKTIGVACQSITGMTAADKVFKVTN
ncbi:MAG: ACP S-malonyltransferase [Deltaproteobacteria bacterium HGW-Deltaproteobacteria-13]|jgi:[acyl-carrier-protein] S-malonyltransferase/trans-AT polyketide synthase/acyltransferase/oxidoreductase domain-containing protein|nr:MAG: ACP S-malonyltransferase [Deltaproteobacteria bacterium HGW-Deltaproteobacteria-13]